MEEAWNRGDFRGYMEGFANPYVVFVSRGKRDGKWVIALNHVSSRETPCASDAQSTSKAGTQ